MPSFADIQYCSYANIEGGGGQINSKSNIRMVPNINLLNKLLIEPFILSDDRHRLVFRI